MRCGAIWLILAAPSTYVHDVVELAMRKSRAGNLRKSSFQCNQPGLLFRGNHENKFMLPTLASRTVFRG
jgi:hypothetical protein